LFKIGEDLTKKKLRSDGFKLRVDKGRVLEIRKCREVASKRKKGRGCYFITFLAAAAVLTCPSSKVCLPIRPAPP
jgi:hypothetical protein